MFFCLSKFKVCNIINFLRLEASGWKTMNLRQVCIKKKKNVRGKSELRDEVKMAAAAAFCFCDLFRFYCGCSSINLS